MIEEYTVIDAATGEIKRSGTAIHAQAHPLATGEAMYVGQALSSREWYFVDGLPVAYSDAERAARATRPDYRTRWDVASKAWLDLRGADDWRAQHLAAIVAERDRRIGDLIVFQGRTIQVREVDQKNLSDKLQEMRERAAQGVPCPAQLRVWRDFDNALVPFASDAAYLAWLGGLAIAIAQRGTEAYAWSWQKGADLQALGDDVAGLGAFDPTV